MKSQLQLATPADASRPNGPIALPQELLSHVAGGTSESLPYHGFAAPAETASQNPAEELPYHGF